mmetsp:Transcript_54234/g.96966  ORF Transcript_54234/g.96966 Transcript_54234/m.96966 type:complete len:534 (+) Transcript_54234:156-1757(+)
MIMTNQGASKSEKRQRRHRRGAGKREQSPAEIREEQEPPRTPGAMSGPSKAAMILGTCSPESVTLCRPQPRRAFFCDEVPAALVDDLQAPRLADESSPLSPWSASYGADEELREVFRGSMAKPCDGRRNSVEGRPLSSVSTSAGPTPSLDGRQSPLSQWTPIPPSVAATPTPVQEEKTNSPAQVRKIFVGAIPQDMTQEDLFEYFKNEVAPVKKAWLQHHHTQPGNQTPAPHNHRGFGFVIFHDSAVVDELMGNESSRFLQLKDGRTLDVKRALCSNDIAEKPSNQVDKQQSQPLQQDNKSQSQKQEQQEQKPQLQQQQHHQQQQQQSLTLQQQQQLMQQQQQMMQRQQQLQQPQPQQPQQQQLPMQLQQQQLDQQQPTMVPCMVGCGSMTNGCWAQPNTMWASAQRQVTASPTPVLVAAPMQWTSGTAMQQPSQCPSPAPSPSPQPVMYGLQMPGPSGVVAWAGRCESPAVPSMSSPCDGMDPASQNGRMSPPLSVMPHRPQPQVPYEYESWAAREALERCLKEAMPTVYDD